MKKNGTSIVELLVSLTIFLVVISLAVGSFIAVSRMKALTSTMRESQEKLRIANEMISRYAKEANIVEINDNGKTFIARYTESTNFSAKFQILDSDGKLYYSECYAADCSNFSTGVNLLTGEMRLDTTSYFKKIGNIPPSMEFSLKGVVNNANFYYKDDFALTNSVILGGIK